MMGSNEQPHALCFPFPFQSHIKAMLKLAKLLYTNNFRITFINTEFNHERFLASGDTDSFAGLPGFRFETIPDGLPPGASQDVDSLCHAAMTRFLGPFRDVVAKVNSAGDCRVSCMVSDGFAAFPITVGEELGIPVVMFFTIGASALMPFVQYGALKERGLSPLKDESYLTNGFMDTRVDWMPGMNKAIRFKDLPTFLHTTDPNDTMLLVATDGPGKAAKASAVVINTFDALEAPVLAALAPNIYPNVLAIGPIQLLLDRTLAQQDHEPLKSMDCNLWKEDSECLQWLSSHDSPSSVIYVNFGSIAVVSPQHLIEFGWGLANSKLPFLWVIRPDQVEGDSAILPPEFVEETKGRSFITSWCPQEEVLNHPAVGGFLTHCGWNSVLESLSAGVPMVCWTFFADQSTNSWYVCNEWGVGMEIDRDVKRGQVEEVVREVMEGEKGKEMKKMAMEWKRKAEEATGELGASSLALNKLVSQVLLAKD